MKLRIPRDYFSNPTPPRLFLCTTGGKRIGEIQAYDTSGTFKWASYSEATFSVDRTYTDVLTGQTYVNPIYDKIEGPRLVEMDNIGRFIIQDNDTVYGERDNKTITIFSSEYTTASKYLENFYVNNGAVDSIEVTYESSKYGANATKDDMYKLAVATTYDPEKKVSVSAYDPAEQYFYRVYKDSRNYTYEQIKISDESEYASHFGSGIEAKDVLYIHGYANVQFYDQFTPELSLLHNIFKKIPGWKIGHVDYSLWHKERTFEEDRIAVYDFLMNEVQDKFDCVVEWDTLTNTVNFYEEAEDGITEDNTVQTRFNTDVYITKENLANEINVKWSTDDIKTKLKVSGADEVSIREVNLGKNYIMNLDYYHNSDWMEPDLLEAYDDYLKAVDEYSPLFTETMQGWVKANDQYNELMNAVPAEGNVVLVGDEFEELYCIYGPMDTAYLPQTVTDNDLNTLVVDNLYEIKDNTAAINKSTLKDQETFAVQGYRFVYVEANNNFKCIEHMVTYNERILVGPKDEPHKGKLSLYHVIDDTTGTKTDNILLRLKNANSDIATIRIYNKGTKTEPVYNIQSVVVSASTGIEEEPREYGIGQWVKGELTAEYMKLEDYTVQYIGTMGAYFVLAKNETQEATLEEYGINLLKEKHDTYVTIFQTQTEAMFSQEKYQCIAQNEQPDGDYGAGTRWLDTNSSPAKLYQYTEVTDGNKEWKLISAEVSEDDQANYENYQRYIDNYEKMVAVQKVLLKKEKEATYLLDGFAINGLSITSTASDEGFYNAARYHFGEDYVVSRRGFDKTLPLYTFSITPSTGTGVFATKPTSYSIGDMWIIDEDNVHPKAVISYIPATFYTEVETYYVLSGEKYIEASPQPQGLADIQSSSYYIKNKVVLTAIRSSGSYSDSDWGDALVYAVYLKGTTPYVARKDSQGVYQSWLDYYSNQTEMERFFDEGQWARLSPLIREDEFSDSNFLLTSYESEEERLRIYRELLEEAAKKLKTLSQPSLEFSMEMANILALPEFEPIWKQFALGNFIRIELGAGLIKRARLLEVQLNFSDLSDFSATFGNLVTTKSEVDKHADLLKQAVTAGKQVAASAGDWQTAVDKSNKLEESIVNGLQDAALQIGRASGQAITWDERGFFCRKFADGSTNTYLDGQIAIINNKIVFTNDGWKTSKAALGEFEVDTNGDGVNEKMYGLLADAVVSGYVKGSVIEGGSLKIGGDGGTFIVNEDGSVEIKVGGQDKYASTSAIKEIDNAYRFHIVLSYDKSTVFSDRGQDCTITCKVYDYNTDITEQVINIGGKFSWKRVSSNSTEDDNWNAAHIQTGTKANQVTLGVDDVEGNSQISCSVDFDENQIKSDETQTNS